MRFFENFISKTWHPAILPLILAQFSLAIIGTLGLGWFAGSNMDRLQKITQDLYIHPFAVSNAATELKSSLFQLRTHMLQIVMVRTNDDDFEQLSRQASLLAESVRSNIAIIKENFLGDMDKVRELEIKLDEWDVIRAEILSFAQKKDWTVAENLVRTVGTSKFSEIVPFVGYVSTFAHDRAKRFAQEAQDHSDQIISRMRWIVFFISCFLSSTGVAIYTQVKKLQNDLKTQATTDALTAIPNRRHFMELAEREFNRAERYGESFALALADLDFFKAINDTYGHQSGDLILKQFCKVCSANIRSSDVMGRIGGEEFAILLPNTTFSEALEIIDRTRKSVEASCVVVKQLIEIRFTASFGVTVFSFEDTSIDDMMRRADNNLYAAKENGRNQVYAASVNMEL